MADYKIISLIDNPQVKDKAALWFSSKWKVPLSAYIESMDDCLTGKNPVPQWYVAVEDGEIIGGMGVIANDFHNRPDLTPNVCAVYTEPEKRGQGIAGALLDYVCRDMKAKGFDTLYLITNHTSLYERFGWQFYCMVQDNEGDMRMYIHKQD